MLRTQASRKSLFRLVSRNFDLNNLGLLKKRETLLTDEGEKLKQYENEFLKKIQASISLEAEKGLNEKLYSFIQNYINEHEWTFNFNHKQNFFKLSKTNLETRVNVLPIIRRTINKNHYNYNYAPDPDLDLQRELHGEEDFMPEDRMAHMLVTINRESQAYMQVVEIMSIESKLRISRVFLTDNDVDLIPTIHWYANSEVYMGPRFYNLDKGLQKALLDYLGAFGVDDGLMRFVEIVSFGLESDLYRDCLDNIAEFLSN